MSQVSAKSTLKQITREVHGWPGYLRTSSSASKTGRSSSNHGFQDERRPDRPAVRCGRDLPRTAGLSVPKIGFEQE